MRFEPTPPRLDRDSGNPSAASGPPPSARPTDEAPSSLALFLGPLGQLLDDPEVTEICINEPGCAFVER